MEAIRATLPGTGPRPSIQPNPEESLRASLQARPNAPKCIRILQDRGPMKCVVSQQLVRVAITLILPVS